MLSNQTHPSNQAKIRLYGNSAAVCFEATMNKEQPTVNVEVAPKPDGHTVDWSQKITIQLSHSELVYLAGVFLGLSPGVNFPRSTKGIKFERQPGKVFVSASSTRGMFNIPLQVGDCVIAGEFCLYQLTRSGVSGDINTTLASVKGALALNR